MSNGTCVKGTGVDGAASTVGSQQLREGGVEVVGNEGGDDIFVAIWDDEEMTSTSGGEVV